MGRPLTQALQAKNFIFVGNFKCHRFCHNGVLRSPKRALAILQVVNQLISNVVGTFHNEFPFLVSQPNDAVVRQVVAKGDFEDSLNLKGEVK